jgi:hypothetical protein
MTYKLIPWRGKTYRAVELTIFPKTIREKEVTVSVDILEEQLLPEIDTGIKNKATELDDTITYYVTQDEIKLTEKEIREIVESALSEQKQ